MSPMRKFRFFASIPLLLALRAVPQDAAHANWPNIGASPGNSHYSTLQQINRSNVSRLKVAWTFQTNESGGLETTPIVVDGILYAYTPSQKVIALDAATGNLRWKFDAGRQSHRSQSRHHSLERRQDPATTNVSSQESQTFSMPSTLPPADPSPPLGTMAASTCAKALDATLNSSPLPSRLPACSTKTSSSSGAALPKPCPPRPATSAPSTSTPALSAGPSTPSLIPENPATRPGPLTPGRPQAPPTTGPEWRSTPSGASSMSPPAQPCPTSTEPLASAITSTPTRSSRSTPPPARRLWHFQGVHHDLWDRDFPAAPILVSVKRGGKLVPAIAQTTKQGTLYLFDRTTGKPLFPIEERPALPSGTPGEIAAKTQPHPLQPEPFAPQAVTEDTLTQRTPEAHAWAVNRLREMRNDGQFVPLSVGKDTLVTPSFEGGAEWGGPALDPQTGILYINANNYASMGALAVHTGDSPGRATYLSQCSVCHGDHRQGSPPAFPSLLGITQRLTSAEITATIHDGRGRMPAIPLQGKPLTELLTYLATPTDPPPTPEEQSATAPSAASKTHDSAAQYTMTGYRRFNDPDGYPATATPWGTLNALDLATGRYLWKIPLGQYPELAAQGLPDTGSENYGGPIVTAGGLLFIAATNFDHKIRAFDKTTGKLLWEATLPFAGNATPITYQVNGRQYLVIAAGGSSLNPRGATGGVYVAFALPE